MTNREWAERAMRAGVQPAESELDQILNRVAKLFAEHERAVRKECANIVEHSKFDGHMSSNPELQRSMLADFLRE